MIWMIKLKKANENIDELIDEVIDFWKENIDGYCVRHLIPDNECLAEKDCGLCKARFFEMKRREMRDKYRV